MAHAHHDAHDHAPKPGESIADKVYIPAVLRGIGLTVKRFEIDRPVDGQNGKERQSGWTRRSDAGCNDCVRHRDNTVLILPDGLVPVLHFSGGKMV